MKKENIDLAAVVASAVESSRPVIEAAGHVLEVAVQPEPAVLHADGVRVAQILTNLLNNAAKYTRKGGRIQLTAMRDESGAMFSVRDNGIGISPDMLPRVFDMFVQADDRNRPADGGLGIGLSLARTLAEMHGGSSEGRSEGLGRGSEFILRLPALAPTIGS